MTHSQQSILQSPIAQVNGFHFGFQQPSLSESNHNNSNHNINFEKAVQIALKSKLKIDDDFKFHLITQNALKAIKTAMEKRYKSLQQIEKYKQVHDVVDIQLAKITRKIK